MTEHFNEPCERHEREIEKLQTDLAELTRIVAAQHTALERDFIAMRNLIPKALGETLGRLDERLSSLGRGQDSIILALQRGYVTVAEFEPVKKATEGLLTKEQFHTEFDPLKRIFWGAMLSIIGGLIALIYEVVRHVHG